MAKQERAKEEVLNKEGDAYFERNLSDGKMDAAIGCRLFDEFLFKNLDSSKNGVKILEVGCCYGYNLLYLCEKYGFEGYGIEPSKEAVCYGNNIISESKAQIILKQGTADNLEFESDFFNIVIMAFCMFWVDRNYVMRALSEADRVLQTGGFLAIWDFDTRIPYRRVNVHNEKVPTFKYDIAHMFLSNPQYSLVEKRSYSHMGSGFHRDIQERCALNVLYKEKIEDAYIFS